MPHKGQYELEYDPKPTTGTTKNKNGTTAWVIIKNSTNAIYGPGKGLKVHICTHNPCVAQWTDGKYGAYGPPVHMQRITCMGPTAAPLLPLTAAPIAEPSSTTTAVAACTPTAGAASIDEAVSNATKHHAIAKIRNQVLALAREIRKPQAWIGYIAFILFGLLHRVRPQVWEGAHKFCVIEQFAPWALEYFEFGECAYAAIPCALRPTTSGVAECVQIGDDMPLSKMSHYVAGVDVPSAPTTAAAAEATVDESAFAAFYRTLGVHYLPTICDGDCGLDVMCMILGLERTVDERTSLRDDISDYLIDRQDDPWMIDLLVLSCELNPEGVNASRSQEIQVSSFRVSWFQGFKASRFQGVRVSKFRGVKLSRSQGVKVGGS